MLIDFILGQTSIVLRVKVRQNNTGASPGQGLTGLTSTSTGLIISTIADAEAAATAYTAAGSTIQTIATLGTYAAPSASDCRFGQVDATNHPGVYELQIANARFAVSGAKSVLISLTGVSGMADCDVVVPLRAVNPYSATAFLTAINGVAPPTNWASLAIDASTGGVTIKTNNDKTGYSLAASQTFSTTGSVGSVTGSVGSVASNVTVGGYASGQDPATLVLDVAASAHDVANSIGAKVNSAGSAGDPWATAIPGSYSAGQAGYIVAHNLDTNVGSRSTFAGGAVASVTNPVTVGTNNDKTGYSLAASQTFSTTGSVGSVTGSVGSVGGNVTVGGYASGQDPATLVLDVAASAHELANSIGAKVNSAGSAGDPWATAIPGSYSAGQAGYIVAHNLDTNVGSRSTYAGGAVASVTNPVTVGTNSDKTGYSLAASQTFSTTGSVGSVTGSVGSVASNVTVGGYASGQDPATLVLDVAASAHDVANSIGAKVNSTGSAGDPWATAIPGSYSAGQAGYIVAHNLDTNVGSRSTYAGGAVASVTAGVTVTANNDKTGYALAASQTFSTTGSVGSVTGSVGSVASNVTVGGYASGQDPATLVLDAPAASYHNPNSVGSLFSAQGSGTTGSASDPWATPLPGSYLPGTAGAILGGNLDAQVSAIKTMTDGLPTSFPVNFQALAVDATTGGVNVLVNQDKSGYNLGASGLDAIQVESGVNARQALSPILASAAGMVSGAGTGTIVITGGNASVTRITATTDKLGNRSAVTLALPPATSGGVTTTTSSYFPAAYFPTAYFPAGKPTPSA